MTSVAVDVASATTLAAVAAASAMKKTPMLVVLASVDEMHSRMQMQLQVATPTLLHSRSQLHAKSHLLHKIAVAIPGINEGAAGAFAVALWQT